MAKTLVIGTIPFNSFKEKNRLVNMLHKEIGRKVRITVENSLILYEYYEISI